MRKRKGLFMQMWSDTSEGYFFDDLEKAIRDAKEILSDLNISKIGCSVKIYDLTKIKPIKEFKLKISEIKGEER